MQEPIDSIEHFCLALISEPKNIVWVLDQRPPQGKRYTWVKQSVWRKALMDGLVGPGLREQEDLKVTEYGMQYLQTKYQDNLDSVLVAARL